MLPSVLPRSLAVGATPVVPPPPSLPQVEARLGQALDVLAALRAEGRQFDLVFLDADKKKYVQYYEALLGVGGLWGGLW